MSIFKIVRLSVYAAVLVFSLIVLGLAVFFDHIIINNDLTRFIPLSIFVAACTWIILPTLLVFGLPKRVFLVSQVRTELGLIGFLALFWTILGILTAVEPETTIDCDFEPGDFFALAAEASTSDAPYTDAMYQIQYSVLKSFSILNALILVVFLLFLALLALRQHRLGRRHVWTSGITSFPFFATSDDTLKDNDVSDDDLMTSARRLPPVSAARVAQAPPRYQRLALAAKPEARQPVPASSPGDESPRMNPGGHYIMYIPPPPPQRR